MKNKHLLAKKTLEYILENSNSIIFENNFFQGDFKIQTQEDLKIWNNLENGEEYLSEIIVFNTKEDEPSINDICSYKITVKSTQEFIYASYQHFIKNKLENSSLDKIIDRPTILEDHISNTQITYTLIQIINLIKILQKKFYTKGYSILIFCKTHCDIPIRSHEFSKYIELAKEIKKNQQLNKALYDFYKWLESSPTHDNSDIKNALSNHEAERFAIAASELIDQLKNLPKEARVFNLLENIDAIYQSVISKYYLYLEDFKYSKFNDKLEENVDKFLEKVTKVINDLQNQILSIPLSAAFLATFKPNIEVNHYIYLAFCGYSLFVYYSTMQQLYNLSITEEQIRTFIEKNKIPTALQEDWNTKIKPVKNKITYHKYYLIIIMLCLLVLFGFVAQTYL